MKQISIETKTRVYLPVTFQIHVHLENKINFYLQESTQTSSILSYSPNREGGSRVLAISKSCSLSLSLSLCVCVSVALSSRRIQDFPALALAPSGDESRENPVRNAARIARHTDANSLRWRRSLPPVVPSRDPRPARVNRRSPPRNTPRNTA